MTLPLPANRRRLFMGVVLFFLTVIGAARIIFTYHVFSQTSDEPAHVAAGMEWLERGTYTFEPLHPPLARVASALGPYLSGLRLPGGIDMWAQGNALFFANDRYVHNLSLARLGVLPFFLVATFLVWYWGRMRYGDGPALVATFLFTTSPVVLAHAGLATTDMALAATFTAALLAFIHWLEGPSYARSAAFGAAVAIATLSKFSALVFLPACATALLAWRWFLSRGKREPTEATDSFRLGKGLAVATLAIFLIIWAGYRFSISSIGDPGSRPHPTVDHFLGESGSLHNLAYSIEEAPLFPAPAFFRGLAALHQKEEHGHKGYLLGQIRQGGWWYFFPVALAVKNTLPFLIFVIPGIVYLARSAWLEKDWVVGAPVIAALALLLVCMPARINIGIRHILPIFPLLAIIGGVGACRLWRAARAKNFGPAFVLILFAWHLTASIRAHPDYLAYFNELVGQHPEKILVDSDLDWGQDLLRLSDTLRQRHIEEISIAYAGGARLDLQRFGLPPFRILAPHQRAAGWIAISLMRLQTGGAGFPEDSFRWVEAYKPVCLVGRSIRLYYLSEPMPVKAADSPATKLSANTQ